MTSKNLNKYGAIYMSAIAAFFRIGYNMYNNKLRSIELSLEHQKKLKLRLNADIQKKIRTIHLNSPTSLNPDQAEMQSRL